MLFQKTMFYFLLITLPSFAYSQHQDSIIYKIGQMIMIGLPGNAADTNSNFYKDIKNGKVGGISIYEAHLTATNTAENLAAMINTYQAAAPIPLFTAITQEGGIVNRLKTKYGFPPMPSAGYLGKLDNIDSTKYYADNTAFTLSRLGINVNFAPVVDVYMPTNPVLGARERTFSNDPGIIIKHATQVILSHNYFKVNTVLKHFPGHGSSTGDSHLGVTDVSNTWKKEELLPYQTLIKKGLVKAVMTAHIVNENLDKNKLPATLSKKIITGLLRKQLKFNGVIFSDDMQMKAISNEYGLKESIEMAVNAGVDVLLFSGNINSKEPVSASDIVDIFLQLLKEGRITNQQIETSYKRIIKMKEERKSL
jgi:beta-N-acetylhexosaminidase